MPMFLTDRMRKLMGLPEPEGADTYGPGNLAHTARCCDKASVFQCTCDWYRWTCPTHGESGSCHPSNTHN